MAKPRAPRAVKFGPRQRRLHHGPRKPRWMKGNDGEVGVRTVFSSGALKSKSPSLTVSGSAEVEANFDCRHLVDALRTTLGIHTGRCAKAAVRPDTLYPHGEVVVIRGVNARIRDERLGANPALYEQLTNEHGKLIKSWARPRMLRSGQTAEDWRVGKITGTAYGARSAVYVSDEVRARYSVAEALGGGYDFHTVRGSAGAMINRVVLDFAKGCLGRGVTIPDKPPSISARAARAVMGPTWYTVS